MEDVKDERIRKKIFLLDFSRLKKEASAHDFPGQTSLLLGEWDNMMNAITSRTGYNGQTFDALALQQIVIERSEFEDCEFRACSFQDVH